METQQDQLVSLSRAQNKNQFLTQSKLFQVAIYNFKALIYITVKRFWLLQPYFGYVSCIALVYMT